MIIVIHTSHYINAEMQIPNATNFNVTVKLSYDFFEDARYLGPVQRIRAPNLQPKGYSLICVMPEKNTPKYRAWIFGERKDGDTILYARSKIGMGTHNIEYTDFDAIFTAVMIKSNVSHLIMNFW